MLRFNALTAFCSIFLLASCGGDLRPEQQQQRQALTEARLLWAASQLEEYRLAISRSCFCPPDDQQAIVVMDDGTLSAYRRNGQLTPEHPLRYSVEDLFDDIEQAIVGEESAVTVSYHETYGYPTRIAFDWLLAAVDDEVTLEVELTSHQAIKEALAVARQAWATSFADRMYNMRVDIDLADFPYDETLYVSVADNGELAGANTVASQQSIAVGELQQYSITVQQWFAAIEHHAQDPLAELSASFQQLAGYPEAVRIQPSIFDAETVMSFDLIALD